MIELKNITVVKQGQRLLEDFHLTIAPGEHWVIQGANGSGKTLLLQVIAGLLHPFSGEVRQSFIKANDWDTLHQQRLEKIHYIPTQWIQAFLGGLETLFYQQRYYSVDETMIPTVRDVFGEHSSPSEVQRLAQKFGVDSLLDLPIIRLSNGQLKKVIIVRQLMKNIPRLLVLDYPFDGLDAESRRDLVSFLDMLAEKYGIQIIMAAHGPELPRVINRRLVLDQYRVVLQEKLKREELPPETTSHGPANASPPETPGEPVVEMKNLTIAYGGKKILSNLDWRIRRGEKWALTGRNGSGKTTLFSLIYADHPMAYSQQVYLFGRRRGSGESIWDVKRRISYFGPEQIHFLNPATIRTPGRDYILQNSNDSADALENLIRFFEAGSYIDRPVRILSSGQLHILLLIKAFMDKRELLLLDEPFQFLDEHNRERLSDYLNHSLKPETTLVLITHDERDVHRWTHHRKHLG